MSLHFRKTGYDGWQYNFNGKCSPETFERNRGLMHRFRSIESKHPDKCDQIRYFYPAFAEYGFVKSDDIRKFELSYKEFVATTNSKLKFYEDELYSIAKLVNGIHELLGVYNQTPFIYDCYIEKRLSYDSLILLSLAIPDINNVCSEESFLWQTLIEKVNFDSKFYKLYIKDLKTVKQNTIAVLKNAWNLKG